MVAFCAVADIVDASNFTNTHINLKLKHDDWRYSRQISTTYNTLKHVKLKV